MYCIRCGAQMKDGQAFCIQCGQVLPSQPASAYIPPPPAVAPNHSGPAAPKKGGKGKIVLLCAALVLLAAGGATGALWLVDEDTGPAPRASSPAQDVSQGGAASAGNSGAPMLPAASAPTSPPAGATARAGYALSIGQCVYDDAQIYVDGQLSPATPVNGTVQLGDVALNSVIRIQCTVDDIQYDAELVFTDANATTLSFGAYTTQVTPGAEYRDDPLGFANREQEAEPFYGYLEMFYSSLLTSVSESGNVDGVLRVTRRLRDELAQVVPFELQYYSYDYQGSGYNPDTLIYTTDNGRPALEFLAFFQHRYAPLGGGQAAVAQVYYTVQMIYVEGEWKVNRWAQISEADFNNKNRVEFNKTL